MAKITDYKIVQRADIESLQRTVLEWMHHGWQPLGGAVRDTRTTYMQTLVKYGEHIGTYDAADSELKEKEF